MKRSQKVNKGAPSGLVISLIFHGVVFFLAGIFVVFQVLPKEEPVFEPPPPVERPKMKLKKPKVKVQKSSTPKPSSRIVAKVKTAKMPDIQIPDLVGTGTGLLAGTGLDGDFLDMPEIGEGVTVLGSTTSIGNDLVGTFYDFKRGRNGSWKGGYSTQEYLLIVNKFIKNNWNASTLSKYYRSPKKLYAQCVVIPPNRSDVAPAAFDPDPDNAAGGAWMVHYKGKLVHKDGITFRFVCSSDYFIVIRVDGEIVWAGVWNTPERYEDFQTLVGGMFNPMLSTRKQFMGNDRAMAGEWITLEPGAPKDIDIIIGDENGECGFVIAVEEKDAEYENGPQGKPILPIFRTAVLSHDMVDQIYRGLGDRQVCVTNGPVFCDYDAPSGGQNVVRKEKSQEIAPKEGRSIRTWSFKNGQTLEAVYVKTMFDKLVLKDADGKELTFEQAVMDLSDEDKEYLVLENPPAMKLDFRKSITRKNFSMVRGAEDRPPEQRANFGVLIKQDGSGDYPYPLTVDVHVIGKELKGNRYILLDRFSAPFQLKERHKSEFEYYSKRTVRMTDNWPDSTNYDRYGEQYFGFLIVVKDKRGKVIAMNGSNGWLEDHWRTLEERYVGNYMDDTAQRTYPTRPRSYIAAQASGRL